MYLFIFILRCFHCAFCNQMVGVGRLQKHDLTENTQCYLFSLRKCHLGPENLHFIQNPVLMFTHTGCVLKDKRNSYFLM